MARELSRPICELSFDLILFQMLALPFTVIRILHGQRRQIRSLPGYFLLVEKAQIPKEKVEGPAVGDDMVHGDAEKKFLFRSPNYHGSPQWPSRQIERRSSLFRHKPCRLGSVLDFGQRAQIHLDQFARE